MKNYSALVGLIMILLCPLMIYAKKKPKYVKGYVITLAEDTLKGEIRLINPAFNEVKVIFLNDDGKKMTYKARDLKGYAFEAYVCIDSICRYEWIYYTRKVVDEPPVAFASKQVLMEQEKKGMVNLYNYYIAVNTRANYRHCYYLERQNGEGFKAISKKNFLKEARAMFRNHRMLYQQIGQEGFRYEDLPKIVDMYNDWAKRTFKFS